MLLMAEKTTALPDDRDFIQAHGSLTTFTMLVDMTKTDSITNTMSPHIIGKRVLQLI